jgi:hypothetical protein
MDDVSTEPSDDIIHTPLKEPMLITDKELISSCDAPLSRSSSINSIHESPVSIPDIPPSHIPGPAKHRTTFDSLKLHRIFGCCRFRNQNHIVSASKNATHVHGGELLSTIDDFTTINNPPKGKHILKRYHFLDKVHMDIVYGDCLSLGGFHYA